MRIKTGFAGLPSKYPTPYRYTFTPAAIPEPSLLLPTLGMRNRGIIGLRSMLPTIDPDIGLTTARKSEGDTKKEHDHDQQKSQHRRKRDRANYA